MKEEKGEVLNSYKIFKNYFTIAGNICILPMQSVLITTTVVSSSLAQVRCTRKNIM
jgi:hypothetical protein